MRFLAVYLCLLFLIKIGKSNVRDVINSATRHYGTHVVRMIRRLEKLERKLVHRLADIEFSKTCLAYNLYPKMTQFKLNRPQNQSLPQATRMRTSILRAEIAYNRRQVQSLREQCKKLKSDIRASVSLWFFAKITEFVKQAAIRKQFAQGQVHKRKLADLGLEV